MHRQKASAWMPPCVGLLPVRHPWEGMRTLQLGLMMVLSRWGARYCGVYSLYQHMEESTTHIPCGKGSKEVLESIFLRAVFGARN